MKLWPHASSSTSLLHCCYHSRCDSTWVLFYSDSQCFYHMTHIRNLTGVHINTDLIQLNWSFTMNGLGFFPPIPSFPIIPSIPSNPYSSIFSSSLLFCTARHYELQALTPGNQGTALVLQRPTAYFIIIITGMHERVCACASSANPIFTRPSISAQSPTGSSPTHTAEKQCRAQDCRDSQSVKKVCGQ